MTAPALGITLEPGSQKVLVYNVETGEASQHWPIDAREMLATGEWTLERPEGAPEDSPEDESPSAQAMTTSGDPLPKPKKKSTRKPKKAPPKK